MPVPGMFKNDSRTPEIKKSEVYLMIALYHEEACKQIELRVEAMSKQVPPNPSYQTSIEFLVQERIHTEKAFLKASHAIQELIKDEQVWIHPKNEQ